MYLLPVLHDEQRQKSNGIVTTINTVSVLLHQAIFYFFIKICVVLVLYAKLNVSFFTSLSSKNVEVHTVYYFITCSLF
jgi:hypothetical protein